MVWTTKKFRLSDCQAVSIWTLWGQSSSQIGADPEHLKLVVVCLWAGLDGAVGGRCFLEVPLLHHSAGHHVSVEAVCQQPKASVLNISSLLSKSRWYVQSNVNPVQRNQFLLKQRPYALCVGMPSRRSLMTRMMKRLKSSWCLQILVSNPFFVYMYWGIHSILLHCVEMVLNENCVLINMHSFILSWWDKVESSEDRNQWNSEACSC